MQKYLPPWSSTWACDILFTAFAGSTKNLSRLVQTMRCVTERTLLLLQPTYLWLQQRISRNYNKTVQKYCEK
ncbi:unnamed protein product [Ceratitis capitata]|uniref:(Mediterranean fruit fly) hypothetical protein n=1 Tax=Ceratitis capitata TaxID=7213 RepID=A0A811VA31_CERCA|nr:unnamed protein product [Ceratitis capitata]